MCSVGTVLSFRKTTHQLTKTNITISKKPESWSEIIMFYFVNNENFFCGMTQNFGHERAASCHPGLIELLTAWVSRKVLNTLSV